MYLDVSKKKTKCQIKASNTIETNNSEKDEKRKNVIFRIADELYIRGITLLEAINSKVYDKVIDGCEYQLIRKRDLIACLKKIGLEFDEKDKKYLDEMLIPVLNDSTDVKELIKILGGLGINEDIPPSTKTLDYFKLDGRTIRTFNKIIKYLKEYDISDVLKIIPKEEIDLFTVVSIEKEHTIETIRTHKFRDLLRSKEIINYGEDIEEEFIDLLLINEDHEDIIVLKKFQKYTKLIQKHKYFSFFGCEQRFLASDYNNLNLPRRMVKRYSQMNLHKMSNKNMEIAESNKDIQTNPEMVKKIKHVIEMWKYKQLKNKRIKELVNKAKMAFLKMIENSKAHRKKNSNLVRLNDINENYIKNRILDDLSEISSLKESVTPNDSFVSVHDSELNESQFRIRQMRKKFGLAAN